MSEWRPIARPEAWHARARVLAAIRAFFAEQGILEVDTPVLSRAGNPDPHLDSLRVVDTEAVPGRPWYLQTSPELPMKRLLAADAGAIYQLCKVFRGGESGRRHNPEFTLLEWYRPGFRVADLMDEIQDLLRTVLEPFRPVPNAKRLSYREAFQEALDIDPLMADIDTLRARARTLGLAEGLEVATRDDWLDLLLAMHVCRGFGDGPVFVFDYPATQAALARLSVDDPRVAQRFELFWGDLELANGFGELTDSAEQRARFERDNARRRAGGAPEVPIDERLLAALEAGLPQCAGVALGVDRLLMVALGADSIDQVLTFPVDRA
jgi:lysyl-tRNA synthetase class 2